jgi:hypothetical protein
MRLFFFSWVLKYINQTACSLKYIYRKARYYYWLCRSNFLESLPLLSRSDSPKVLLLLPEAGIKLYTKMMLTVGSQLKLLGYQVYFIRCFNVFERCNFMDSEGLPIESSKIEKKVLCTYCYRNFETHVKGNGFDSIDLRHFTDEKDREYILGEIAAHPNKTFALKIDDINLTGILECNLFLFLKKSSLENLSSKEIKLWQEYLISLYVGYCAVKRIFHYFKISHSIMIDEYSFNSIIAKLAENYGVVSTNLVYPFHKDVDLNKIRILQKDALTEHHEAIAAWPNFRDLSLGAEKIRESVDDLIHKMSKRGTYSYSPSKRAIYDMLQAIGFDKNRKTIVAYPSSPDEMDALLNSNLQRGLSIPEANDAFDNQINWLDELIAYVESSDTLQLVVRLHPRMAPNHREKTGCADAGLFYERFSKKYNNVKIIWPDSEISSFDLAEIADVVTVSWSSMGAFMARLGIPVVSGLKSSVTIPNDDFHVFCDSKEHYFKAIERLSHITVSFERMKRAYRFYNMMYLGYSIELGDVVSKNNAISSKVSKNADFLKRAIIDHENVLNHNLEMIRNAHSSTSILEEEAELTISIYRLVHFFMTNNDELGLSDNLYCEEGMIRMKSSVFSEDNKIIYNYNGEKYIKYSPMLSRLLSLVQVLPEQKQGMLEAS